MKWPLPTAKKKKKNAHGPKLMPDCVTERGLIVVVVVVVFFRGRCEHRFLRVELLSLVHTSISGSPAVRRQAGRTRRHFIRVSDSSVLKQDWLVPTCDALRQCCGKFCV